MIVTVGNTKGGCGKTTIAVNLAAALARRGRDTWLVDADSQATAQTAVSIRAESGVSPGIACSTYPSGPTLRAQLLQQGDKYEEIVIDAGGRDTSALRAALTLSDVLIVPYAPRSFDVWALENIVELIDEANSVRDGLRCFAVLNNADPGEHSTDNTAAEAAIANFPQLVYLPAVIRRRKAFSNAAGCGLSVFEHRPKDPKAVSEFTQLMEAVYEGFHP